MIIALLCLATPAMARDIAPLDIRPIIHESVDVFAVLQKKTQADQALAARDYRTALSLYQSVALHDPKLLGLRTGLRQSLMGLGDWAAAAHYVEDAQSVDAAIIAAMQTQRMGPVKAALQRHSDAPRLWNVMGYLQDTKGDHSAARQSYAMADMAGQRAGLMHNNIGQSYFAAGEYKLAADAFSQAVKHDPSDAQFDNNHRRAQVAIGDIQAAIRGLNSAEASVFLAQAGARAAENGENKLAKLLLEKSLILAPRYNPHVAAQLEHLYTRREEIDHTPNRPHTEGHRENN